ncbi:flagellar biosynthetic protein FliR [Sphingomonas quercus]|uniref:Flagellar biosynthetic protein FliR n=1 Tax=Sphingomonas quercus TaxID=2842451 RepID=A0ABS6BLA3_9SPHN|nr:flagellar biosynthetic protein FliR [Sphingomonas quercus]MBU3078612.1 flagellar biosynthetic protein FliR [Sphingomonas quercus]
MASLPIDLSVFLIVFVRVGAVAMLLPVFSESTIPAQLRLLLALGLSMGLYGMLSEHVLPAVADDRALPGLVISEMLIGLAMGGIINLLFKAVTIAGGIISLQVGLSSVLVPDPDAGGQSTLVARFITVAATIVCMSLGVHHLWIASIVKSYAVFPVGGLPPAQDFARLAIDTIGQSMRLAIGLAAPLIAYGILFNVALGLAARMAPTIQIFFISQPLNIVLGLSILISTMGAVLMVFANAMGAFMQTNWGG